MYTNCDFGKLIQKKYKIDLLREYWLRGPVWGKSVPEERESLCARLRYVGIVLARHSLGSVTQVQGKYCNML